MMATTSTAVGRNKNITWAELKQGISEAFSTDRVDVDEVQKLLTSYASKKSDWEEFAHFDKHT